MCFGYLSMKRHAIALLNSFLTIYKGGIITLVNIYVDLVYLRVLPVLHRPEVVDIDVNTI